MRVAIAQMIVGNKIEENFKSIKCFAEIAKKNHVELIVFPECSLTGYLGVSLDTLDRLDVRRVFKYLDEISEIARNNELMIVVGQYIKRCGDWYNNLLFFDKKGKCKNSYDKSHLIDDDCYHVKPGNAPSVFNISGINFYLGICHDIRYPEHAMWGGINGAQIYINAFNGVRNLKDSVRVQRTYDAMVTARAIENGVYILAPNVANNEQMIRSQVISPQGDIIIYAKSKDEDLLICDIDESLAGSGWVKRRRSDIYNFDVAIREDSFFEKSYWQKEYYMINHNEELYDIDLVKKINERN
mgnify:CR=1 FL=1